MTADVRQIRTAAEQALAGAFSDLKPRLVGAERERADAFRMFEEAGLPHRRVEEWKYTDLRALMREAKPLAGKPGKTALASALDAAKGAGFLARVDARRLVVVNGTFVSELSDTKNLEAGLSIASLSDALARNDGAASGIGQTVRTKDVAVALNTAFMTDGVIIRVADGAKIERPIIVAYVFTGNAAATFTRSMVTLGNDAALTLVETFEGPADVDYQVNTALDAVIGDRAHFDHVKVGRDGGKALHLGTTMARVGAEARMHDFAFTTGGAVTRNQVFLNVIGDDSKVAINGGNLLKGRQHVDTTLVVDHASLGCESRELFKHVLDDESRGIFQGKIIVQPGAQKTDGKMASHALLLSESAEADNKPELEIFADDVVCGHGATAGALDEELLFYLMARGIPKKESEALLIQSFVGEAIETIEHEGVREALLEFAAEWLKARG
ncbi:MAG: Fe-S cluster assembly protein SufD [Variibacter sp.]